MSKMIILLLLVICHVDGNDNRQKLLQFVGNVHDPFGPSFRVFSRKECILWCTNVVNCSSVLYCDIAVDETCFVSPQSISMNRRGQCELFSTEEFTVTTQQTCENGGTPHRTGDCDCPSCTVGDRCETRIRDCQDVFNFISVTPGIYTVCPLDSVDPFEVQCDDPINYDIVMMHRDIHSPGCTAVPVTYLDVGWETYQQSFSEGNCYFWLGLEKIHALTTSKPYQLHIYVKNFNLLEATASYSHFQVGDVASRYMMTAAGFSASNSLIGDRFYLSDPAKSYSGTNFCTDGNCVSNEECGKWQMGGWWYTDVCFANPHNQNGIQWAQGNGSQTTMKEMTMTLRPEVFLSL